MFKCPNCGADLKFSPKAKSVTCDFCDSKFNPKELKQTVKKAEERKDTFEGKKYLCNQCGAELLTFDETAITFCSYCGSQAMIESKMVVLNAPEYIIPFKKTQEECIKEYKKVLSKALFAPSYMKSDIVLKKFRGIYIPYCIYTLGYKGIASNTGSRYSHRSGNYDYYDDYTIKADIDATYEGISYDLISKFYDEFSHNLPFNYKEVEPFNFNYMGGFYADTKDVDDATYDKKAENIARADSKNHLLKRKEFAKYGCHNPTVGFHVSKRETGMFPIYFLAIRTKKEDYVYYAVVNGQTGKVAANLPIDFKKYILGSLILSIPIFLLTDLGLVLTPHKVTIFSLVVSIISLFIAASLAKKIKNKENHTDDLGLKSKDPTRKKVNIKTFKYSAKQLIAIIIAILLLLANPVDDLFYYGGALVSLLLVILTFNTLIKEYNVWVRNKLPQLEKRGGDERE